MATVGFMFGDWNDLESRYSSAWLLSRADSGLGSSGAAGKCTYMWPLHVAWASHSRMAGLQGVLAVSMPSERKPHGLQEHPLGFS